MKKKIICIAMISTMLLGFAGCSKKTPDAGAKNQISETTVATIK